MAGLADDLKKSSLSSSSKISACPAFEKMVLNFALQSRDGRVPRCRFARLPRQLANTELAALSWRTSTGTVWKIDTGNEDAWQPLESDPRGTLVYKGSSPSLCSSDYRTEDQRKENDWSRSDPIR